MKRTGKKEVARMVKGTVLTRADEKIINDSISCLWQLSVNLSNRKMEYRLLGKYAMAEFLAEAEYGFADLSRRLNSLKERLMVERGG